MGHRGVVRVAPEGVLLAVGSPEDEVTQQLDGQHSCHPGSRQVHWVVCQVAGGAGEHKWHPCEVPKGQHVAKSVSGDVHRGEDGGLIPQGIHHVVQLEHIDQHHGVSHTPDVHILLVCHAQIDDHPADQAWVHLAELLPVKHARPWIQLPAHPKVVPGVAAAAVATQQGPLPEGRHIQPYRQGGAEQNTCSEQLKAVGMQPRQVELLRDEAKVEGRAVGEDQQQESIELVSEA
mmetsp:Transcript_2250/g.5765  ORF Transcript_2250/g.5765 Transcript_2250/m.5765 type:complete len:233 (+) Transcript_2250:1218-1916(+)